MLSPKANSLQVDTVREIESHRERGSSSKNVSKNRDVMTPASTQSQSKKFKFTRANSLVKQEVGSDISDSFDDIVNSEEDFQNKENQKINKF